MLKTATIPPAPEGTADNAAKETAAVPMTRHRVRKIAPWLVLLCAIVLLIALDRFFNPGAFPVQRVNVSGEFRELGVDDILAVVKPMATGNLFAVDLENIEAAIEDLPWVAQATVRRRWPEELVVHVVEHRPIARWGSDAWINSHGEIFRIPDWNGSARLPRLEGAEGSHERIFSRFRQWSRLLVMTSLQIRELHLNERDDWVMQVSPLQPLGAGGRTRVVGRIDSAAESSPPEFHFPVYLGKENLESHLLRFARVFRLHLADQATQIRGVDLRYPNGFSVSWVEDEGVAGSGDAVEQGELN